MGIRQKTILLLLFSSFMSVGWGQDCDEGYTEIDGECYYQSDLDVLQQFIDNSQEGDNPPPSDLSPIDLGHQDWSNGRIYNFICEGECSGLIPEDIVHLTELDTLMIYGTIYGSESDGLEGHIPEGICEILTDNDKIFLSGNKLCRPFPSCFDNCNDFFYGDTPDYWNSSECFDYEDNNNNGKFDNYITYNYTYDCECEGEVNIMGDCNNHSYNNPGCNTDTGCFSIDETTYLYFRDHHGYWFYQNNFSFPPNINQLVNLTSIDVLGYFEGEIPYELGDLVNLNHLNLSGSITGELNPNIGNLMNLSTLNIRGGLQGSIPPEIGNLTNLESLSLSSNQLTGEIPSEIGELINLTELNLHGNQLTGEIPSEIGNLTNLLLLKLHDNQIIGDIPYTIGNLTNLFGLHLWNNQLSGEIPSFVCSFNQSGLWDNNFCPPYPECLTEEDMGYQDTSNCEEECPDTIEGDLNYDGIVNILDVVTLVTCILSDNRCDICYDINYDGEINVVDIISLVNIILDI